MKTLQEKVQIHLLSQLGCGLLNVCIVHGLNIPQNWYHQTLGLEVNEEPHPFPTSLTHLWCCHGDADVNIVSINNLSSINH